MTRQLLFVFVAVAGFAVAVDGFWVEPYRIEVTHSSVQAPLTGPLKIAHLSDLHSSGLGRRERQLLGLLDAEQPDVIVSTRDTVTRGNHHDNIQPILSHLHAPRGVWLVRGNWENDYPLHNERAFYSQLGIHFRSNKHFEDRDGSVGPGARNCITESSVVPQFTGCLLDCSCSFRTGTEVESTRKQDKKAVPQANQSAK